MEEYTILGVQLKISCNNCDLSVHTYGPWEFYRNSKGVLRHYGHPTPNSKTARKAGIYGLAGNYFCLSCGKLVEVILVEFKTPCYDAAKAWSGDIEPKDEYKNVRNSNCPNCGGEKVVQSIPDDDEINCPKCKIGIIKSCIHIIT